MIKKKFHTCPFHKIPVTFNQNIGHCSICFSDEHYNKYSQYQLDNEISNCIIFYGSYFSSESNKKSTMIVSKEVNTYLTKHLNINMDTVYDIACQSDMHKFPEAMIELAKINNIF